MTPYDNDHRNIGTAPVFEVVRLEQIFEAEIGFAYILAASRRLDLNAKQLAERRTAIGLAQLEDAVRPGFESTTRVVDELHFEDELLDGGLAELAQDLAVRDSLSHRPDLTGLLLYREREPCRVRFRRSAGDPQSIRTWRER